MNEDNLELSMERFVSSEFACAMRLRQAPHVRVRSASFSALLSRRRQLWAILTIDFIVVKKWESVLFGNRSGHSSDGMTRSQLASFTLSQIQRP